MRLLEEAKSFSNSYKGSEILKSITLGVIFFNLVTILIVVVTFNIAVLYIAHLGLFIILADLLIAVTAYFAVKVVYITLLNYNDKPESGFYYIKKIDLIITPIAVFLIGLIVLLFI